MIETDRAVIHSSEDPNWRTPPALFQLLQRELIDGFGWDLAADAESALVRSALPGAAYLGPGSIRSENALTASWAGLHRPIGFLNPPFSRTLSRAYSTGRIKVGGVWQLHEQSRELAYNYEVESWAQKCWYESRVGFTVYALLPFAPQTAWYRWYVYGHGVEPGSWSGHAAMEERRIPHRVSFLRPDGSPAGNAGVNSVIIVWRPATGIVGPWQPFQCYWDYK